MRESKNKVFKITNKINKKEQEIKALHIYKLLQVIESKNLDKIINYIENKYPDLSCLDG